MKAPIAAKHLSPAAKKLWKSLHEEFDLDNAARMILLTGLEAMDRKEQARAVLAKEGITQTDRFGFVKPRPEVAIERDSATTLGRCFRLLGFDLARAESGR
jgi:phage terminase small subunit